jgi:hypothetical protein
MSFRLRDHNKVLAEGGATKKKAHHKKIPELTDAQVLVRSLRVAARIDGRWRLILPSWQFFEKYGYGWDYAIIFRLYKFDETQNDSFEYDKCVFASRRICGSGRSPCRALARASPY